MRSPGLLLSALIAVACAGEPTVTQGEGSRSNGTPRFGDHPMDVGEAAPQPDAPPVPPDVGAPEPQDGGADAEPEPDVTLDAGLEPPEPFTCTPVAVDSPWAGSALGFDPATPWAGGTLIVVAAAQAPAHSHHITDAVLLAETADGPRVGVNIHNSGGGPNGWDFALADVPEGEICVLFAVDGGDTPIASGKIVASPRPADTRNAAQGVYRLVTHHQKTCDDNAWGIDVEIRVEDAAGNGVPDMAIAVEHNANESVYCNGGGGCQGLPSDVLLTTGADGRTSVPNGYCYGESGIVTWRAWLVDFASDHAVEITTGYWDNTEHNSGTDDDSSCTYCPGPTACHWGYRLVWRLDPGAVSMCDVPTDHAGQAACSTHPHGHVHPSEHDPAQRVCWPVP